MSVIAEVGTDSDFILNFDFFYLFSNLLLISLLILVTELSEIGICDNCRRELTPSFICMLDNGVHRRFHDNQLSSSSLSLSPTRLFSHFFRPPQLCKNLKFAIN